MRLITGLLLAAAIVAVSVHVRAEAEVSGRAHVIDGDTIHLSTGVSDKIVKVRLQGVAAPERNEVGGAEATKFVEKLVEGRQVRCELDGSQSKDRGVGVCFVEAGGDQAGGRDIGAAVIEAGLARDCPRFSAGRYKALEPPEAAGLPYPSYCVLRQKSSGNTGAPSATAVPEPLGSLTVALNGGTPHVALQAAPQVDDILEHGGGLNGCGCHFNRKTGECHCHRGGGCGCACEPSSCAKK